MKTVVVAFEILPEGSIAPVGHTYLYCHIVLDKKATLQRMHALLLVTYDRRIRIFDSSKCGFQRVSLSVPLLAALNGSDVLQADVKGAYLNAKSAEKLYTKCGPEFGEFKGQTAVIQ